jgi:hypothetical protein
MNTEVVADQVVMLGGRNGEVPSEKTAKRSQVSGKHDDLEIADEDIPL